MRFVQGLSLLLFSFFVQAQSIPIETLFKFPDITSVKISPDGIHLAAAVESDGKKKLVILNLKDMKVTRIINFTREKQEVGNYGWLNNSRVFYESVRKYGPLDKAYRTGNLFAHNIDGSKFIQLLPSKGRGGIAVRRSNFRFLNMLPEEKKYVLVSLPDGVFTSAYRLNIYSGHLKRVEKSPAKNASLLADLNGTVRLASSFDEEKRQVQIHLRDIEKDEWSVFKSFGEKEVGMRPIGFTQNNEKVLFNVRKGSLQRGIYALDLETKSMDLIKAINNDADITGLIYSNDSMPEVIGFKQMPGFVEKTYFSEKHHIAKKNKALKEALEGLEVDFINYTNNGKKAIVQAWSDTEPGQFFLFDMETYNLEFLLKTFPWIKRNSLVSMEPISFTTRDKKEIRGYLTRPKGKTKDLPMVVMVHGGPFGVKDEWSYNPEVQFFANRGYAVLQVNYRGSGGRGGRFQYDAYKMVGGEMQNDLTDGTHWAINEGIANKDRICIYGASYGGYAAMMGIAMEPDLYKCGIGYVGLYDIDLMKRSDIWKNKSGRLFSKEAWGIDDEDFVKERSPINHVKNIKAAVMLIHGAKDQRVHVDNIYDYQEALDAVKHPYETLIKPYEEHGFYKQENIKELYTKLEKFLLKHIGN